jgi:cystathionine gamma-synthase
MSVFPSPARGRSIPPDTPHSILFSLPEWEDNIELAKGNKILCDTLETTYPRFQVAIFVKQVRNTILLSFWLIFSLRLFLYLAGQHNTVGFPI